MSYFTGEASIGSIEGPVNVVGLTERHVPMIARDFST
jgi:hypothetical protein